VLAPDEVRRRPPAHPAPPLAHPSPVTADATTVTTGNGRGIGWWCAYGSCHNDTKSTRWEGADRIACGAAAYADPEAHDKADRDTVL
jgi:hypothetical protein